MNICFRVYSRDCFSCCHDAQLTKDVLSWRVSRISLDNCAKKPAPSSQMTMDPINCRPAKTEKTWGKQKKNHFQCFGYKKSQQDTLQVKRVLIVFQMRSCTKQPTPKRFQNLD